MAHDNSLQASCEILTSRNRKNWVGTTAVPSVVVFQITELHFGKRKQSRPVNVNE